MSDGGADVPEHNLVTSIVWYNNNCAGTAKEKVDGVAVNNEDFPKYGSKQEKMNYLTNLAKISRLSCVKFIQLNFGLNHRLESWQ